MQQRDAANSSRTQAAIDIPTGDRMTVSAIDIPTGDRMTFSAIAEKRPYKIDETY